MDRTSWKPKIYKATETVDYKAEEEGTSDGAKKGWLTRQRGGSAEEPKKDFVPIDWAGTVGSQQSWEIQNLTNDLMDFASDLEIKFGEGSDEVVDGIIERYGTNQFPQEVIDILEDENYHSVNRVIGISDEIPDMPDMNKKSSFLPDFADKKRYEKIVDDTMNAIDTTKINGFPFWKYVGVPDKILEDGKGGIVMYGMKKNPNSIRRVDVKYDEGRDTYTVSFMSNRNKPKGEYNDVYFDQLGGLIAGNKGLGVESYATEDDYKYDWDQLTSLAQKALSDIGYDKESWDSEPEDIRKEMEKVAYSEENWKEVANKFYKEELNKGKKIGGEAMYGYGSATGRMSPVEAWNQGADVYGDMGYDQSLRNPIFTDFRGLKWNELPTDIQEAWKSELGYYTQGEGLVDNIEKQLNRFGVNLDRDPEQVEESSYKNWTGGGAEKEIGKWIKSGVNQGKPNYGNYTNEEWEMVHQEEDATDSMHSSIGSSNREADYYPSRDIINNDVPAKNQGQSWQKGGEADPCWKGYKQIGMKDKNGKQVPNCVPKASERIHRFQSNRYDNGKQCPECNGTGEWKDVVDFDCPRCNGTGLLSKSSESEYAMGDYTDWFMLWDEHEENVIPDTMSCDYCFDQFNVEDKQGMINHINSKHDANVDPITGDTNKSWGESKAKANEEGVNDWWDRVTTDGGDLDMQFRGTHFNELPLHQQNHYFNLYMEELGNDKYGNHMALYDTRPDSYSSSDLWKDDPSLGNKDQYYTGWKINEPTVDSFDRLEISGLNGSTRDNDMMGFLVKTTESKASENEFDNMSYLELRDHILTMQNKNPSSPWYEDGYLMTRAKNILSSKRYLETQNESNASESYLVEWGYDLDYDFAEIDNLEDAKQKAIDKGGNVYLDNTLVYSVIPSKKIDPANDKSGFVLANHLMNVESKANEDASDQCPYCEGEGCEDCLQTGLVDGKLRDVRYPELKEEGGNPNHDPSNGQFTSEGFDQGLYGYVDAKCKTCGIEFDSIPDMDDHYAMNSDHISNLNDLDSDIPNSD